MGTPAADDLWAKVAAAVRAQLSEATWNTWFQGVHALDLSDDTLILGVPSSVTIERLRTSYLGLLTDAVQALTGVPLEVDAPGRHRTPARGAGAPSISSTPPAAVAAAAEETRRVDESHTGTAWLTTSLNPRYTFDQFVIGASNRFAHAAALSVAESPARSYNPLFIYGPAGLGKTHLLHAIGHHVRELFSNKRVRYVSTETIMNEFVDAIRAKHMPGFKRRYRELDVLLIDDIQFLERTEQLQEEFFHTFNQLHGEAARSSSRPTGRRSRSPPSRTASAAASSGASSPTSSRPSSRPASPSCARRPSPSTSTASPTTCSAFIADNIIDNVRELEGALIRVAAYSSLNRVPLSRRDRPRGPRRPAAGQPAPGDHPPADPRRDRQDVRLDHRRPLRQEPPAAARHRPPDRHVRVAGAHRLQLPEDRRGVRRPRPHHGHVRRATRSRNR